MQVATQSRSRYWWRAFVDTLDVHDLDGELVGVAINIVYLVFVQACHQVLDLYGDDEQKQAEVSLPVVHILFALLCDAVFSLNRPHLVRLVLCNYSASYEPPSPHSSIVPSSWNETSTHSDHSVLATRNCLISSSLTSNRHLGMVSNDSSFYQYDGWHLNVPIADDGWHQGTTSMVLLSLSLAISGHTECYVGRYFRTLLNHTQSSPMSKC